MAQRGRPRKVPVVEPTDDEATVAEFLSKNCGIYGCTPKNHIEEARELLAILGRNSTRKLN